MNINKPLRVAAVFLKDNPQPLHNCFVYICDSFLIVAQDENDTSHTWYNIDNVERLEGVELIKAARIAFF